MARLTDTMLTTWAGGEIQGAEVPALAKEVLRLRREVAAARRFLAARSLGDEFSIYLKGAIGNGQRASKPASRPTAKRASRKAGAAG